MSGNGIRHFLDLAEIPPQDLRTIIDASRSMKAERDRRAPAGRPLAGKTLAMIFDKPSTRTRVSFDVAMRQLGGEAICLTGQEMQLGRGETISDTARVLSRYVDAIMIRILDHDLLTELARHATVPVINGLTKRSHPCQVMADVMTAATPTTCSRRGCRQRSASSSACAWPRRPNFRPSPGCSSGSRPRAPRFSLARIPTRRCAAPIAS
jgi:ornithine carbamoyltransferase